MNEKPIFSNYTTKNDCEQFHYSRAVRIGPLIKCAGQGGWDLENVIPNDVRKQIEIAYENVARAVKSAGGNGWDDVISIRSYHLNIDEQLPIMVELAKKYMPNHKPIWTCVEVTKLGDPEMLVEIEVEAYVNEQAQH